MKKDLAQLTIKDENGEDFTISVLDIVSRHKNLKKVDYIIYLMDDDDGGIYASILNEKRSSFSLDVISDPGDIDFINGEIKRVAQEYRELLAEMKEKSPANGSAISPGTEYAGHSGSQTPSLDSAQSMAAAETVFRVIREVIAPQNLRKGHILCGAFADLAPEKTREARLLRALVVSEGHLLLMDSVSRTPEEQRLAIEQAVTRLTKDPDVDVQAARELCTAFLRAMGGKPASRLRDEADSDCGPKKARVLPAKGGKVVSLSYMYGFDGLETIQDAVSIAAGGDHALVLRANGTVVAAGYNEKGQCNVSSWRNIVAVAAGHGCSFGVKADGTVVAAGELNELAEALSWKDVTALAVGYFHIIGLRSDGTVLAAGKKMQGALEIAKQENLTAIAAGNDYSLGLRSNGKVVLSGVLDDLACISLKEMAIDFAAKLGLYTWSNITAIAAGPDFALGLRANGTVVSAGQNTDGQRNVSSWRNIVDIAASGFSSYGLTADGTVVSTRSEDEEDEDEDDRKLASLRNVISIFAGNCGLFAIQKV